MFNAYKRWNHPIGNPEAIHSNGQMKMIIAIESILTAITIGFWMTMATWFFYWLFLIGTSEPKDKSKRDFYFWGWLRFGLFTLLFTGGYTFFIMEEKDWIGLVNYSVANAPKIIASVFWTSAFVLLVFFLIYRGLKKRRTIQF